jgi:hypothetical protein
MTAFRPEIDDMVNRLDHIEMMLDENHGVAGVDQPVERVEQLLDVGQMQPRGRFVEDVDRVLRALPAYSTRSRS